MFALKKFLVTSLSLIAISASVLPNVFSVSAYAEDVSIDQQEISGNENYTFTLNERQKRELTCS